MSALERELKLGAPARFTLPDLSGVAPGLRVAPEVVQRSTAVYYDTPDLRLTRWECGLRHRSSDGWTAKLPVADEGAALVRREYHFVGTPERVPEAAVDLLLGVSRGAELMPVVALRTMRRRVELRDAEGALLAEVTNDHVAVLDGRRVASRFREVEVEFSAACPPAVVEAIVVRLRRAGTGPTHRVAKHVRALGLAAGVEREVELPEVRPGDSACQVMRLAIARSVAILVRSDAGVRAGADVEDVHEMRVATRRLRSQLRTFRPLLDEAWARELQAELRWLGGVLGRVRDADVLTERLEAGVAELPEQDHRAAKDLLAFMADGRRREMATLLEALRSERYLGLVDRLIAAARAPRARPEAEGPARQLLPPLVKRRWKRLARGVGRLGRRPAAADLHAVRIRAKHTRYAGEMAATIFGRPARRFARRARDVQQLLGEHRDATVASAWLRGAVEGGSREAAWVAGRLAVREERLADEALAGWPKAWRRAADRGRRDWLRMARSVRRG